MSKYDDVSWHVGGKFPPELNEKHASTHIGMFLGWVIKHGLAGDLLEEIAADGLNKVVSGEITGAEFLLKYCDGKLTNEDINEEGNKFASEYYEKNIFISDYNELFGENVDTLYHVEDSVQNASILEKLINKRFFEWKKERYGY